MAEPAARLMIELGARTGPFQREMASAAATAKSRASEISNAFASIKLAGGAIVGGAITTKFLAVQREFDVLNASLKTVTGSSEAAEREMKWIKELAAETRFGLAQATQAFVKMKALGLDPSREALTSYGNTAAAMGKDLNQMIEAVADASTGEFERLKEFGIKAKKDGNQVALTFQGTTTTIGNSSREIVKYLEGIGKVQFAGAMAERAKTLDGSIAALGDSFDELFRTAGQTTGATTTLQGVITTLDGAFVAFGATMRANEATIQAVLGALGGAAVGAGLLALPRAIGAVGVAITGLATVAAANPIALALLGVGTIVGGGVAALKAYSRTESGIQESIRSLEQQNERSEQALLRALEGGRTPGADRIRTTIAERKKAIGELRGELQKMADDRQAAAWSTRNDSAARDPRRLDLTASATIEAPGKPKKPRGGKTDEEREADRLKAEQKRAVEQGQKLAESFAQQAAGLSGDFVEKWTQLGMAYKAGAISADLLSQSQDALLAQQPFVRAVAEEAAKFGQAREEAYSREISAQVEAVKSLQEGNKAAAEEIELMGLSEQQQRAVLRAREDLVIQLKEEALAKLSNIELDTRAGELLHEEIQLLKQRQTLGDRRAAVLVADDEKRKAEEWTKELGDDLKGAFQAAFASTKNPIEAFGNSLASVVTQRITASLAESLSKVLLENVGKGASGSSAGGIGAILSGGMEWLKNLLPFEQGGIMTSAGAVPLRRYSAGGIADSPQLALYGEGRMPEAYVPLPDGRRIPVAMQGGGGNRSRHLNITINPPAGMSRQSGQQFAAQVAREIALADARNN